MFGGQLDDAAFHVTLGRDRLDAEQGRDFVRPSKTLVTAPAMTRFGPNSTALKRSEASNCIRQWSFPFAPMV